MGIKKTLISQCLSPSAYIGNTAQMKLRELALSLPYMLFAFLPVAPFKRTATIGVLMPSSSLPTGLYRVSMETVALSNDYRAGGDKKVPQKSRD
ncbi:hypothetical protein BC455_18085 [Vibrio harveyi]|nr:hypothetical protein BC455_18085 [Vibrio harveyi]